MTQEQDTIEVFVEIPKGSRNKYEIDEATGAIRLDRVLYSSVHYPTDYGFIPDTRADDGDHLDVLVLTEEPTFPGCRLRARPVGVLKMRDEKGGDYKIVAVPVADPRFEGIDELSEVHPHWLREIENFFNVYKTLEPGKVVSIDGWGDRAEAWAAIEASRQS
ncbi:MAG: inorganic diphosphatase [Dehalococcoidia bacterium]